MWGASRGQTGSVQLVQQHELRYTPWELVMAVAWSPDGANLAVSAGDHIHLYRTDSWERITSLYVGALTHSLAFSPQGGWLAAGSRDGKLRLWKVADLLSRAGGRACFERAGAQERRERGAVQPGRPAPGDRG